MRQGRPQHQPTRFMKITAQDEYGLRLLLQIARADQGAGVSIARLSELEGLSPSYVGKLTRQLRMAGFIESTRGQRGGYVLSRPADQILVKEVLRTLGGPLFDDSFCSAHTGGFRFCTKSVNCSLRSLWTVIQLVVDQVLEGLTLQDLIQPGRTIEPLLDAFHHLRREKA